VGVPARTNNAMRIMLKSTSIGAHVAPTEKKNVESLLGKNVAIT
jgi:hypothetical protein